MVEKGCLVIIANRLIYNGEYNGIELYFVALNTNHWNLKRALTAVQNQQPSVTFNLQGSRRGRTPSTTDMVNPSGRPQLIQNSMTQCLNNFYTIKM